ncbi:MULTISPECIES: adenylate kinase [Myroides]|uniref:Adenylate kinase n=2 Tax=Myroides odoratimimus TaxID=76832 RepID=A0AAI8C2U1_9FLAO|nr:MULTISPECIES: adenylate kinase [Myroides]ALU25909.1 adenylate kinase [Myroides odoratimimus]MDM1033149.1 adenylate kinase [Myroides odoratimimus]MDM1036393.1 adenylate kinase [Myroides odoratimimus]MDM1050968.1 adenylate kinase [Myroides odoratimimus]MDM1083798.1 adenylate kinase [Myroides odoratimimus]
MVALHDLGNRICIIGLSSSGKSTLAQALGKKLNLNILHLDQIAHIPNTDWTPRDKALMTADHQAFLTDHTDWVIEGNYSFLMPERFKEATCIIWLDFSPIGALYRYIKRSITHRDTRPGNLDGAKSQFSMKMVKYILFEAPKKSPKYVDLINNSSATFIHIRSFKELMKWYRVWGL